MRPTTRTVKLNKTALTIRTIVGVVVLAAALGVAQALVSTRKEPPRVHRASSALLVRTMTAGEVPVVRTWAGYGAARAMHAADVAAEVSGLIVERPAEVEAGSAIGAGDLLVRLQHTEYEQALSRVREAQAALRAELESLDIERESLGASVALANEAVEITEREFERLRDLEKRGAATSTEIERMLRDLTRVRREAESLRQQFNLLPSRRAALEARLAVESAQESIAELNLDRATIVSPLSGAIVHVDVNIGERVSPGQLVARVVDLSRIEIPLQAPVSAASSIRVGDEVLLTADGPSREQWTGRIARVSPEADPASRTVTVYVVIEQDAASAIGDLLRPGQFVIGQIAAGGAQPRIVVPRNSVSDDRVYVIDANGLAQPRDIRIAHHIDQTYPTLVPNQREWAVIESGLKPGDEVIISNIDDLEAGMPVESRGADSEAAS